VYAEPGHCNKDTTQGELAKKRRDKDGKIMFKNGKMHYDYILHTIMDTTHDLIRSIEITTANVHDSQVKLSEKKVKWFIVIGDIREQNAWDIVPQ